MSIEKPILKTIREIEELKLKQKLLISNLKKNKDFNLKKDLKELNKNIGYMKESFLLAKEKEEIFENEFINFKTICFKKLDNMEDLLNKKLEENKLEPKEEIFEDELEPKEEIFEDELESKEELFENKIPQEKKLPEIL